MPCTHCPFLVLHSLPFSFKIWFVSGAGQLVIYVLVARGLPNADTHTHTHKNTRNYRAALDFAKSKGISAEKLQQAVRKDAILLET